MYHNLLGVQCYIWGRQRNREGAERNFSGRAIGCYHSCMFRFGSPSTPGHWLVHIAMASVALFLIWWLLRIYLH
jgi:hypothetical protein